MTALAGIRDRVEQRLADTGNSIWDTDWIDEGIRQALEEYSWSIPRGLETTLTLSSDTREIDISSITDLVDVERIWTPYTASDREHPPNWRQFEHWRDQQIVYIPTGDEPQNGDVVRVFYSGAQTIQDLDSAASTTVWASHETIIITGAAGHVAVNRALDLQEQVTLGRRTPAEIQAWGQVQLATFERNLNSAVVKAAMKFGSSRVRLPNLDRHHRDWDV